MVRNSKKGFTLAELLMSVLILGIIATFTIPKIISAQRQSNYNAMAKEVSATFSGAYTQYSRSNTVSSATKTTDLTPYLNYLAVDTTSSTVVDDHPTYGSQNCNSTYTCIKLHNGGVIWFSSAASFAGTNPATNFIYVNFDPDPRTPSAGSGVQFRLYYGGRLTSAASVGEQDPSWFQW